MKMNVTFAELNQSLNAKFGELYAIPGGVDENAVIEIVQKYMEEHPPAPGKDGEDGYTPIKGVDYFDGMDGKDGYSPVKGVDYFDGKDGQNGKDGHTPVKGTDYYTDADKAEMVSAVIAALPVYAGEVEAV